MQRRNRHHKNIGKILKDYFAPLGILAGLFLIGIYALFAKGNVPEDETTPPPPLQIIRNSPQTQATIEYVGGKKSKIDSDTILERSEKLSLSSETVHLNNANVNFHMSPGELAYDASDAYTLLSGNLWVEAKNNLTINMRYLKAHTTADNIFSLSQNEVTSSLYVVK